LGRLYSLSFATEKLNAFFACKGKYTKQGNLAIQVSGVIQKNVAGGGRSFLHSIWPFYTTIVIIIINRVIGAKLLKKLMYQSFILNLN